MTRQNKLDKIGATPGKLALMAVLALVLVVVIVRQLPSSNDSPPTENTAVQQRPQRKEVAVAEQRALKPTPQALPEQQTLTWPEVTTDHLLVHDPFVTPAWAIKQVETSSPEQPGKLNALQKQGVSIVMISEGGKSATIGENKVRIGDILEGYQITDITSQGVVLSKLKTQ